MPSVMRKDRSGKIVDVSASLAERWCRAGFAWMLSSDYKSLTASGDYATITFKAPILGIVYYNFSGIDKSGNEIVKALYEGCTVSGGAALIARNFNRNVADATCPLSSVKFGLSTDATPCTISGGTRIFPGLVPGSAQGNSIPAGSSAMVGVVPLKPDTIYAVKFEAKGAATFAAHVGLAITGETVAMLLE